MWTAAIIAGVLAVGWVLTMVLFSVLSRRPSDLGVRAGRLSGCPATPNCVCTFDSDAQHGIEPLKFTGSAEEAWQRLKDVLARHPRTRIVTATEDYLHAECTSLLFRFVDDVECLLDAEAKRIHFRSKSRAGRSDLGVNRARMEAIRTAFDAG